MLLYDFYYSHYGLKKQAVIVEGSVLSLIQNYVHTFFYKKHFVSTQFQCFLGVT